MTDLVNTFRSLGARPRRRPKWHYVLGFALFVLPLMAYAFSVGFKFGSYSGLWLSILDSIVGSR